MSWQTSRGYVSSRERINIIEEIPLIAGYQTSGAIGEYASKDEFPKLALLEEGGYAKDFIFIKDDIVKKAFIVGKSDTTETLDMSSRKHNNSKNELKVPGILAKGVSDGCNNALENLDEKDVLVFWYNGNWCIVKKDNTREEYIPIELAKAVISSGNCSASIIDKLAKVDIKGIDTEYVSSREMAKLMDMEKLLYSKWEYENILHIMLNTDMFNGPYMLKRTGGNIDITFYAEYIINNNKEHIFVPFSGTGINIMGSYTTAIKEGFKKWNVTNPAKSAGEVKGLGDYTIAFKVDIPEINREKKRTSKVTLINTYDPNSNKKQISNVETRGWKINNIGTLTMYSFFEDDQSQNLYSKNQYTFVAAHEFGHLLGIGDAYEENSDGTYKIRQTGEVPIDDIMRGGNNITYNNIEMVFLAALKNQKQEFYDSEAITEV